MQPRTPLQAFKANIPPDDWTPEKGRQRERRRQKEREQKPVRCLIKRTNVKTVINMVCAEYKMQPSDIKAESRKRMIARPRQVCFYLATQLGFTSNQIARHFAGGMHHATILHGVKNIKRLVAAGDQEVSRIVKRLEARL